MEKDGYRNMSEEEKKKTEKILKNHRNIKKSILCIMWKMREAILNLDNIKV